MDESEGGPVDQLDSLDFGSSKLVDVLLCLTREALRRCEDGIQGIVGIYFYLQESHAYLPFFTFKSFLSVF